jgi:hypothetical protein
VSERGAKLQQVPRRGVRGLEQLLDDVEELPLLVLVEVEERLALLAVGDVPADPVGQRLAAAPVVQGEQRRELLRPGGQNLDRRVPDLDARIGHIEVIPFSARSKRALSAADMRAMSKRTTNQGARMRSMRALILVATVAATVLLVGSANGSTSASAFAPSNGRVGGMVPVRGALPTSLPPDECPGAFGCGGADLTYHGGSVMRTNNTYAIYWLPSGHTFNGDNAGFENAINGWLGDVAHDSGLATNVFSVANQYYDTVGGGTHHVAYNSTFVDSAVDTDAFPASGCSDGTGFTTVCLTDTQLRAEIQTVVTNQGWPQNSSSLYFLLTPPGVGSCAGTDCAYVVYCAYHSSFVTGGGEILYANQPWLSGVNGCDLGARPNSNDADPTISVASHEFNEAVTDPNVNEPDGSHLSAWWDDQGYENGDKCAWTFGTTGGTNGHEYNQTINGHHYLMQMEYDNASHSCLQSTVVPPAPPSISGFTPKTYPIGGTIHIQGAGFTGTTGVSFGTTPAVTFNVVNDNDISVVIPVGAAKGKLTVVNGTSATSKKSFSVEKTKLSKLLPKKGATIGTVVQILGTGLIAATGVDFNNTPAVTVNVVSDKEIDATIPSGATSGLVTVHTPGGNFSTKKAYPIS